MSNQVHSGLTASIPGIADGEVEPNWPAIGPRALTALTAFASWVETSGPVRMTERDSDAMFDAYGLARAVIYAADPAADKARLSAIRTAGNDAESGVNNNPGATND